MWGILAIIPAMILFSGFDSKDGFLQLIHFGQKFEAHRLAEVQPFVPSELTPWGYDGQFYAQIAIDPSLKHEGLRQATYGELDYRARRIGLPLLAFCLGMGDPFLILHSYAILNGVFWILLLITLHIHGYLNTFKGFLLTLSVLWTTGTLTSLARALPDLPAVVFVVWAFIAKSQIKASIFLGCSALFKETAILSILRVLLPTSPTSSGYSRMIRQWIFSFLMIQAIYLLLHCNSRSPVWNAGIGFVLLFLFLGPNVWGEQYAYSRVLLPLTVSFNFLIHKNNTIKWYGAWYIAGNLGMTWMCLETIYKFVLQVQ